MFAFGEMLRSLIRLRGVFSYCSDLILLALPLILSCSTPLLPSCPAVLMLCSCKGMGDSSPNTQTELLLSKAELSAGLAPTFVVRVLSQCQQKTSIYFPGLTQYPVRENKKLVFVVWCNALQLSMP